jgi:adenylate cyclase
VDRAGDGRGALTAAGLLCGSCGTELPLNSKFCNECGAPVAQVGRSAEYKQVTVLFADVVHSMDIAAAVGAERLREIMAELVNRAAAVVQRYDGTVGSFTGDGLMAVFGAPTALEDHAIRACLAALAIQEEAQALAVVAQGQDGIDLKLRVGLNSGEVIAGEIGSGALGYTAIGEQVGMAQRMESIAPPGGVMLSASTARLVERAAALGEPELVQIKGADKPVAVQRLLGIEERQRLIERAESNLVGRQWEMAAAEGLLQRAVDGHGAVVALVGSPGIGKSRLVREVAAMAAARGVDVFTADCESHATEIPFHVVARLLRAATGVDGLDSEVAPDRVRDRVPDADPEDLLLFDDLLGIADPDVALPKIDPDARRRRLTALVNAASLARKTPAVYVVEDAHWIDEVSESMLAEFLTVIPQTPSLVLITYRPEYEGALARVHGAQTITLAPLSDSETAALVTELLGPDPTAGALGQTIGDRAAGNPFFAEEMVRDLAERGVLRGEPGGYVVAVETAEVTVPATLQATIAARIDRLDPKAKRTLSAAAVIGSRFNLNLLTQLGVEPAVDELVAAQFIDQVRFTCQLEYVFHHPLIRAVAYESQLKSDRAQLHRRLAAAIQERDPDSLDENAALIAEHLEAAGELREAFGWHMRAGTWLTFRDLRAARMSWQRARGAADRLPVDEPDRTAARVAPRALLCASSWRAVGTVAGTGFHELRELTTGAGDKVSLAMAMAGLVPTLAGHGQYREASELASELSSLVESIGDPTLTVALLWAGLGAKCLAGETSETLRLAQQVIDLADGDPVKGNVIVESPLAVATMWRAAARACVGYPGWKDDLEHGTAICRKFAPVGYPVLLLNKYGVIANGALLPDETTLDETAGAFELAQRFGEDVALECARAVHGLILVQQSSEERWEGVELLARARDAALQQRSFMIVVPMIDMEFAKEKARTGDCKGAIEMARAVVEDEFVSGEMIFRGAAVATLVESLLQRRTDADIQEAHAVIERLAAAQGDEGLVIRDIWLLRMRALLAHALGDESTYRDFRDRYRAMATSLGYEGHLKWAEAMP